MLPLSQGLRTPQLGQRHAYCISETRFEDLAFKIGVPCARYPRDIRVAPAKPGSRCTPAHISPGLTHICAGTDPHLRRD